MKEIAENGNNLFEYNFYKPYSDSNGSVEISADENTGDKQFTMVKNGNQFTVTNAEGISNAIVKGETAAVTFTNTRRANALTIQKNLTNAIPDDVNDTFYFDVVLTDDGGAHPQFDNAHPLTLNGSPSELKYVQSTGTIYNVPLTWTANGSSVTIGNIPVGTVCEVKERAGWNNADNALTQADIPTLTGEQSATILVDSAASVSFTNARNTGSLAISKTVVSPVVKDYTDDTYSIKVKLTTTAGNAAMNGNYGKYNYTITEAGGTAVKTSETAFNARGEQTFDLKNGQTLTITGIPTGVTYTVTEETPTGFAAPTIAYPDDEHVIENGGIKAVQVTNTRATGNLKIGKTVVSPVIKETTDDTYPIKVKLTTTAGNAAMGRDYDKYDYTITKADRTDETGKTAFDDKGEQTFNLKHGQTLTITGIPTDLTYTVSEVAPTNFAAPVITYPDEGHGIAGDATKEVEVKNTRRTGSLKITKNVESNVSKDKSSTPERFFLMKVSVSDADNHLIEDGRYGNLYFYKNDAYVWLGDGQTAQADGLPSGYTYTVTEPDALPDTTGLPREMASVISSHAGDLPTGVTYAQYRGRFVTSPVTVTGSIAEGLPAQPTEAAVTNTRDVGSITIEKTLLNAIPDDDQRKFYFEVTLADENGEAPILSDVGGVDLTAASYENGVIKNVEVVWNKEGTKATTISNIPLGTTYTVQEVRGDVPDNIDIAAATATGVLTPAARTGTASITNTRKTGDLVLKKEVVSPFAADVSDDYSIVVSLAPVTAPEGGFAATKYTPNGDGTYTSSPAGPMAFDNGTQTIQVPAGGYVVVHGIPTDVQYTIAETHDDNFTQKYYPMTARINSNGTITDYVGSPKTTEVVDVVEATHIKGAKIENTRKTGKLRIEKSVVSDVTKDKTDAAEDAVVLDISKYITGRAFIPGDWAEISISGSDGAPLPADKNGNTVTTVRLSPEGEGLKSLDGAFPPIRFTHELLKEHADRTRTFTYTLTESAYNSGKAGLSKVGEEYTVEITVSDANTHGKLEFTGVKVTKRVGDEVEVILNKQGENATSEVVDILAFTNVYEAKGELTLSGTKTLYGRAMIPGEFAFEVTEDGKVVSTGTNDDKGNIAFAPISYDQNAVGSHTYLVKETGENGKGITHDETVHTVYVTVTDNGNGTLTVAPSDNHTQLDFTNTYEAEGELTLSGAKTLTGRAMIDGEFAFEVTENGSRTRTGTGPTALMTCTSTPTAGRSPTRWSRRPSRATPRRWLA